jgi:hypothetical protein
MCFATFSTWVKRQFTKAAIRQTSNSLKRQISKAVIHQSCNSPKWQFTEGAIHQMLKWVLNSSKILTLTFGELPHLCGRQVALCNHVLYTFIENQINIYCTIWAIQICNQNWTSLEPELNELKYFETIEEHVLDTNAGKQLSEAVTDV